MEKMVKPKVLFSNCYANKRVLVTGHTGFKGSWLVLWLQQLGAQVTGYSLGIESPSHFEQLSTNCKTIAGDIGNRSQLEQAFMEFQPDIVFHLAAQSLVRDSYREPLSTYETNVLGTLHVLLAAQKCKSVKAFVNVTTDKVYENKEDGKPYQENDGLGGHDMYSSSKACADILAASFRKSFLNKDGFLLATVRAGNVIGGGDWANERLIPDLIRAAIKSEAAEIRSPKSIRPWEHVLEPLSGYLLLGQKLLEGNKEYAASWNFGPAAHQHKTVLDIVNLMQSHWNRIQFEINEEEAKKFHEAGTLNLDCQKAAKKLNWQPVWGIEKTIHYTTNWYKDFIEKNILNSEADINTYVKDAINASVVWTL